MDKLDKTIQDIHTLIDTLSIKEQKRAEKARTWNTMMHAKLDEMINTAKKTLKEREKAID